MFKENIWKDQYVNHALHTVQAAKTKILVSHAHQDFLYQKLFSGHPSLILTVSKFVEMEKDMNTNATMVTP